MNINNKAILITGANRGIGRALVEEALSRGAKRVYATARQASVHSDERVTPVILDVTNAEQIREAMPTQEKTIPTHKTGTRERWLAQRLGL